MKNSNARGSRSWASGVMVLMAVMAVLARAVPVSALPPVSGGGGGDSPDPIPDACDDVRGTLSATPSFIDRNADPPPAWSRH